MGDPKVWLELELIVVDKNKKPVNRIWSVLTSQKILSIIWGQYPDLLKQWKIKPELDISQIEIVTSPWKPDEVEKELVDVYKVVEKTVKELWLNLLWWVPNQDFEPYSTWGEHYDKIHNLLLRFGKDVRRATNIAWLHLHIESDLSFKRFIHLSHKVREAILNKKLNKIFMSKERFEQMKKVVDALVKAWFLDPHNPFTNTIIPYPFKDEQEVKHLVFDWKNLVKNYNLVGIKKPNWTYTVEVRTSDAVSWVDKLTNLVKNVFDIFLS